MLQFRSSQFQQLESALERDFTGRLAAKIHSEEAEESVRVSAAPDWTRVKHLPAERITAMVEHGLLRARKYGLEDDGDTDAFVTLMFSFAPNFDAHPKIRQILTDGNAPKTEKMELIGDTVTDEEWAEVEQAYDPGAWHQS